MNLQKNKTEGVPASMTGSECLKDRPLVRFDHSWAENTFQCAQSTGL